MTLWTIEEAASFLRFKNPRSLYTNKSIPRVKIGGKVLFVKEVLEQLVLGMVEPTAIPVAESARPQYRIRVRR